MLVGPTVNMPTLVWTEFTDNIITQSTINSNATLSIPIHWKHNFNQSNHTRMPSFFKGQYITSLGTQS